MQSPTKTMILPTLVAFCSAFLGHNLTYADTIKSTAKIEEIQSYVTTAPNDAKLIDNFEYKSTIIIPTKNSFQTKSYESKLLNYERQKKSASSLRRYTALQKAHYVTDRAFRLFLESICTANVRYLSRSQSAILCLSNQIRNKINDPIIDKYAVNYISRAEIRSISPRIFNIINQPSESRTSEENKILNNIERVAKEAIEELSIDYKFNEVELLQAASAAANTHWRDDTQYQNSHYVSKITAPSPLFVSEKGNINIFLSNDEGSKEYLHEIYKNFNNISNNRDGLTASIIDLYIIFSQLNDTYRTSIYEKAEQFSSATKSALKRFHVYQMVKRISRSVSNRALQLRSNPKELAQLLRFDTRSGTKKPEIIEQQKFREKRKFLRWAKEKYFEELEKICDVGEGIFDLQEQICKYNDRWQSLIDEEAAKWLGIVTLFDNTPYFIESARVKYQGTAAYPDDTEPDVAPVVDEVPYRDQKSAVRIIEFLAKNYITYNASHSEFGISIRFQHPYLWFYPDGSVGFNIRDFNSGAFGYDSATAAMSEIFYTPVQILENERNAQLDQTISKIGTVLTRFPKKLDHPQFLYSLPTMQSSFKIYRKEMTYIGRQMEQEMLRLRAQVNDMNARFNFGRLLIKEPVFVEGRYRVKLVEDRNQKPNAEFLFTERPFFILRNLARTRISLALPADKHANLRGKSGSPVLLSIKIPKDNHICVHCRIGSANEQTFTEIVYDSVPVLEKDILLRGFIDSVGLHSSGDLRISIQLAGNFPQEENFVISDEFPNLDMTLEAVFARAKAINLLTPGVDYEASIEIK